MVFLLSYEMQWKGLQIMIPRTQWHSFTMSPNESNLPAGPCFTGPRIQWMKPFLACLRLVLHDSKVYFAATQICSRERRSQCPVGQWTTHATSVETSVIQRAGKPVISDKL